MWPASRCWTPAATPLAAGEAGEKERAGRLRLLEIARREGMRTMAADWAQGMVHPSRLGGPVFEAVLDMFERKTPAIFEAQINALLEPARRRAATARHPLPRAAADRRRTTPGARRRSTRAMADAMPNAPRLVVVPGCGHMSPMEDPAFVRCRDDGMAWPFDDHQALTAPRVHHTA